MIFFVFERIFRAEIKMLGDRFCFTHMLFWCSQFVDGSYIYIRGNIFENVWFPIETRQNLPFIKKYRKTSKFSYIQIVLGNRTFSNIFPRAKHVLNTFKLYTLCARLCLFVVYISFALFISTSIHRYVNYSDIQVLMMITETETFNVDFHSS